MRGVNDVERDAPSREQPTRSQGHQARSAAWGGRVASKEVVPGLSGE
jgi:hypothetical protein